jgi:uncharacterized RDD family membrane protein YckC
MAMENYDNDQEESGLAEELNLNSFIRYVPATQGQRFLNWIIDNLFMQYALTILTGRLVGELIVKFFPDFAMRLAYDENTADVLVVAYCFWFFNYLIYYTFCEKAFRGYTIGKIITGTRTVREDGNEISIKDAFLRSLSRLVPFEVFSGLAERPWHDSWTNTTVVKTR